MKLLHIFQDLYAKFPRNPMLTLAFAAIAGYLATWFFSFALNFSIFMSRPALVARRGKIASAYSTWDTAIWAFCTIAGGYVAGYCSSPAQEWLSAGVLIGLLIVVTALNANNSSLNSGVRQQIRTFAVTAAGIAAGCWIYVHTSHAV